MLIFGPAHIDLVSCVSNISYLPVHYGIRVFPINQRVVLKLNNHHRHIIRKTQPHIQHTISLHRIPQDEINVHLLYKFKFIELLNISIFYLRRRLANII